MYQKNQNFYANIENTTIFVKLIEYIAQMVEQRAFNL